MALGQLASLLLSLQRSWEEGKPPTQTMPATPEAWETPYPVLESHPQIKM